jgi:hypothetical protein
MSMMLVNELNDNDNTEITIFKEKILTIKMTNTFIILINQFKYILKLLNTCS